MKKLFLCLVTLFLLLISVLPVMADENGEDYENDARFAEGTPPMVPHRIDDKTSDACLVCHLSGANGAPLSPHPVRLDCTQCHGQGEIKEKKAEKKTKAMKKKSARHKEDD